MYRERAESSDMVVTDFAALAAGFDQARLQPASGFAETDEHRVARANRHMEVRKKLRHYVATMDLHLTDEQARSSSLSSTRSSRTTAISCRRASGCCARSARS